jgi:hypothetical protein
MPVALDPSEVYRYVISTDRSKPEEKRPTLLFHYPTLREARKIANLFDQSDRAKSTDESVQLRCDAVRVILVGWENFTDRDGTPIPYDPNELDAILTDTDITELHARLLGDMALSEREKKVSALSAPTNTASSAPDAAPANA